LSPYILRGNWKAGWALDLHTVHSTHNPDGSYTTERTIIGQTLYEMKYQHDYSNLNNLAEFVANCIDSLMVKPYITTILPVPPSNLERPIQHVTEIAKKVSEIIKIPIDVDYIKKIKNTQELKSIDDFEKRKKILEGVFTLKDTRYQNKKVLLFDDLFRSGATLHEITKILYDFGQVQNVYVVTLTKTRTKS